ncbi:unnamed protein product, partial [Chrysoparadoxa australica]
MALDAAFVGVGKEEGLTLWRIENKQVVLQSKVNGKFHEGDSYILLATIARGNKLVWNIHFWLGSKSSQDEMGIAAYKAVELDESLGGGPVQYRETQGNESSQFLSLFKATGIEYLPGGVDSGFRKVEHGVYETRLLHLKGKRVVRAKEVECSTSSLNTGDVFILDAGLKLYLYFGAGANKFEKNKGVESINRIKDDERGAKAEIIFIHEDPMNAEFWEALGGHMEITNPGEPDDLAERVMAESISLYRIADTADEGEDMSVHKVKTPDTKLHKSHLDTNDVFILDVGSEVFAWIGLKSSANEKKKAMTYATMFVEGTGRPSTTRISRVAENCETAAFKSFFATWSSPLQMFGAQRSSGSVAKIDAGPVDSGSLASNMMSGGLAEKDDAPVDDGSGTVKVWRVEDFKKAEVPEEMYGQFYGGDSYVILYSYTNGNRPEYIIYYWQGRESSQDEKGASALLAKELDDEMGDLPVQVRVVQGKEPKHFRSLFKGKMIIHAGGRASGFKNSNETDSYDTDGISLFHVKGTNPINTHGVQVAEVASSLNSGDAFVLLTPSTVFTWAGQACLPKELEVAESIAGVLKGHMGGSREMVTLAEGSEPEAFWEALGGKGDYPKASVDEDVAQEPRLFQISNATGKLAAEEIGNFDQEDLCADDVMLLDVVNSVFVWVGSGSNEMERREALAVAQSYIDTATDGRSSDTSIVKVNQGREPALFTQHFRGWDAELFSKQAFVDPFEAKMEARRKQKEAEEAAEEAKALAAEQARAAEIAAMEAKLEEERVAKEAEHAAEQAKIEAEEAAQAEAIAADIAAMEAKLEEER